MATKTYFIGLGGCGIKTVSELQKKLCPNGVDKQDPQGDVYQFTYIDTDEKTKDNINKVEPVILNKDYISLGDTNPSQIYRAAVGVNTPEAKRFMEWMIPSGFRMLQGKTLRDVAGAERMIGRTVVYHFYRLISSELEGKIRTFATKYEPGRTSEEDIWVVASSCGGTGSSITMDVLYMISKIVNKVSLRDPNLKLVLFMPQPFIERNRGDLIYPLNAYSCLWEINAFRLAYQQGRGNLFKHFSARPDDSIFDIGINNFPLFRYIIPVDNENSINSRIELDNLYSTVAEMIYYMNIGTAANSMNSNMSNYMNQLTFTTKPSARSPFEWSRSLVPCGYRVIKKADDALLQYIRIRGTYEVLKYGLIGSKLSKEEATREKIKKEFGRKYILSHICDLPEENVSAGEGSLQSLIEEKFQDLHIPISELTTAKAKAFINNVNAMLDETKEVKDIALKNIKEKVNEGVKQTIIDFGLDYVLELLNIVDDFYLEKEEVSGLIRNNYERARECAYIAKQSCERLYNPSRPDKELGRRDSASLLRAMREYKDWKNKEQLYRISGDIISELTKSTTGYLEILRKKCAKTQGLREVFDKINSYCSKWEDKYQELARSFMNSKSDAYTVNIPDLAEIATGENSTYWAKEHVFDRLYCSAVIDYDRQEAVRDPKANRIPIRSGEGTNNLKTYIEPVAEALLNVALSEDELNFESKIERELFQKLNDAIDKAINMKGTALDKWLGKTLDEVIEEGDLPGGKSKENFLNDLNDKSSIPVLYPKSSGGATEPDQINYIYATSSEQLATKLGYVEENAHNQFIKDESMADRILIIKMELGLDFVSYKYFEDIQRIYMAMSEEIKEGHWGCHLHREFANLNIEESVKHIQGVDEEDMSYKFFRMLYCQTLLDVIKDKNRALYNSLFGIFLTDLPAADTVQDVDSLSGFFEESNDTSSGKEDIDVFAEDQVKDKFFEYDIDLMQRELTITIRNFDIEDNNIIRVDPNGELKIEFIPSEYSYGKKFIQKLLNTFGLNNYLNKVENLIRIIEDDYKVQIITFMPEIRARLVNRGTRENPGFYILLEQWRRNGRVDDYVFKGAVRALSGK